MSEDETRLEDTGQGSGGHNVAEDGASWRTQVRGVEDTCQRMEHGWRTQVKVLSKVREHQSEDVTRLENTRHTSDGDR